MRPDSSRSRTTSSPSISSRWTTSRPRSKIEHRKVDLGVLERDGVLRFLRIAETEAPELHVAGERGELETIVFAFELVPRERGVENPRERPDAGESHDHGEHDDHDGRPAEAARPATQTRALLGWIAGFLLARAR